VALIPVLKKAKDAGIPIINIDNRLDPAVCAQLGLDAPFISVNNEQGAYLSAKYISDKIKTPTKVVILEGIRSAKNAEDRKNGAIRAFKENPQITIAAQETANWKIDEAYTVSKKLFASQPDVGAVFCANDMMALGTIEYLKESGRKNVLVAGYDALDEAKKEIRSGMLQVTINQQADVQGYLGVKMAVQAIGGEKLPPETLIDVKVISKENL
jgi:ribose transport system substrate-binding protein